MKKVLSVLLIAAAAFGFYGGAVSINDVLSSKAYWEEEGVKTTKDLNKLEDGLNELKANTAAYKSGLKDFNDGQITLANGKAQYAAGEKALADAESQYGGPGVPTLALLYSTINSMVDAKGNLNKAAAIVAGNSGGQVKAAQAAEIYTNVSDLINGYSLDRAADTVAKQGGVDKSSVLLIFNNMNTLINDKKLSPKIAACQVAATIAGESPQTIEQAYDDMVDAMKDRDNDEDLAAFKVVADSSGGKATEEQVKTIYEGVSGLIIKAHYELDAAELEITYSQVSKNTDVSKDIVRSIYTEVAEGIAAGGTLVDVAQAVADKYSMSEKKVKDIYNGVLSTKPLVDNIYEGVNNAKSAYEGVVNAITVYNNVSHLTKGYTPEEAYATVAAAAGISDPGLIEKVYLNTAMFYNGVTFDHAARIVADSQEGMDEKLVKQGYEGYKTYVSGKKQLAESLPQIQAGEAQLADGKKKLDQYRDGEKTLREGLATLMGTKADPGLKSIAERVGKDETFTGVDGFFNFDAGFKGVKMGRAYQEDTGALITKELTSRAIGLGVGIGAGVVALLAAVLALLKKNKGAAVAGLVAAAAAGFGAYYVKAAGTFYTEGAGSTVGNLPMIAMCVLAGVALIFAIANFAAPKAEVEVKTEA